MRSRLVKVVGQELGMLELHWRQLSPDEQRVYGSIERYATTMMVAGSRQGAQS